MRHLLASRPIRLLSASLIAAGVSVLACTTVERPAGPSPTTYPTVTITADGIARELPFLVPGSPLMFVNNDSRPHRLHLDQGPDQPGCGGIETSGELAPGESRLTAPLGDNVVGCQIHDHMSHGDQRFAVRLSIDSGE